MSDERKSLVGQPLSRVDGKLKVTGGARYSADWPVKGLLHAVVYDSTVSRGRVASIDASAAKKVPGVVAVFTHQSGLKLRPPSDDMKTGGKSGNGKWMPLQDPVIHFNGQQIALVVGETLEAAEMGAAALKVRYSGAEAGKSSFDPGRDETTEPKTFFGQELQKSKGDAEAALSGSDVVVMRATYETPNYNHNPIEPHATVADWAGDKLTVYDATQGVVGTRSMLAQILGVPPENVRVVSHFLGGGFGCKGFFWPHTALAAAVARKLRRPVKLVLTRPQMFTFNGHRSRTVQEIALAAARDGKLRAIRHVSTFHSSRIDDFVEPCGLVTKMLYETPAFDVRHRLVRIDVPTPCPMRAPGEAPGTYALECAMDELAYKLGIDPLRLRMLNYAEKDPENGKQWSSKRLRECYEKGAEMFGWSRRKMEPGSMRDGRWLVGWGMGTAAYPGNRTGSAARAVISADGKALVTSATQDIGTGTYTIMTQIAADTLGLPMERVRFELGDTAFPKGASSGGSQTAVSSGNAVRAACAGVRGKLLRLALADAKSPLHGVPEADVVVEEGRFLARGSSSRADSFADILKRAGKDSIDATVELSASTRASGNEPPNPTSGGSKPGAGHGGDSIGTQGEPGPDTSKYSFHSFGAAFAEVRVDPELGLVRLGRMVGAYDIGKVLNAKTARSQAIGGMTWAAGMALLEETRFDPRYGRITNHNLADYLVPVHADVPPIDVWFTDVPDPQIGDPGARGVGEIPITGMAAAIANAVYHATGKRIRDLPILPEKLI